MTITSSAPTTHSAVDEKFHSNMSLTSFASKTMASGLDARGWEKV